MTKILFWNVDRKPLERLVANFAALQDLDILLLAESEIAVDDCLDSLRDATGDTYRFLGDLPRLGHQMTSRLHLYTRLGSSLLSTVALRKQAPRTKIFRIHKHSKTGIDTLLILCHAPSKLRGGHESEQRKFFRRLAVTIKAAEEGAGHQNMILVGDFNADPFEAGLASIHGIQGVPTKTIARRGYRRYDGEIHRFFYNPMWGLYGDRRDAADFEDPEIPGTYYFKSGSDHRLYWHMYDQVLIRPSLLDRFPLDALEIIGRVGKDSLLDRSGKPAPSDHLPLVFQIDLSEDAAHVRH